MFNRTVEERDGMTDQLSRVFGDLAAPYAVSIQAVSKHLKVLEGAGLVTRSRDAQRRPVHLEAEVFDLMTTWIERYRREAEARYQRLDAVLAELNEDGTDKTEQTEQTDQTDQTEQGETA